MFLALSAITAASLSNCSSKSDHFSSSSSVLSFTSSSSSSSSRDKAKCRRDNGRWHLSGCRLLHAAAGLARLKDGEKDEDGDGDNENNQHDPLHGAMILSPSLSLSLCARLSFPSSARVHSPFFFLFCTRAHNRHLFLFLFFLIKISLGLLVSALALCAYLYWNIAILSLFPDSVVLLMGH